MGKTYLKSEHIDCQIIKVLLQTLHNTFLYQLLLQDTRKQHSSLDKRRDTSYQLSLVSVAVFDTNLQEQGREHLGQGAEQLFHPLSEVPQSP